MREYSKTRVREAEKLDRELRFIRHYLRRSFASDETAAGLTAPQTNVMALLTKSFQNRHEGMAIREIVEEVGLSQSTVSGIVDRLAAKGLVTRESNAADKRQTVVRIADPVKDYLSGDLRDRQLQPLLSVLSRATPDERKSILSGIGLLYELLEREG